MKQPCEMIEGREAAERFNAALDHLLSIPRQEYLRREETYQAESAKNPSRPGPKPKKRRNKLTSNRP